MGKNYYNVDDISSTGSGVFYFPHYDGPCVTVGTYLLKEDDLYFPSHIKPRRGKKKGTTRLPPSRLARPWVLLTRPDCDQKRLVADLRALIKYIERAGLCVGKHKTEGFIYLKNGKFSM